MAGKISKEKNEDPESYGWNLSYTSWTFSKYFRNELYLSICDSFSHFLFHFSSCLVVYEEENSQSSSTIKLSGGCH